MLFLCLLLFFSKRTPIFVVPNKLSETMTWERRLTAQYEIGHFFVPIIAIVVWHVIRNDGCLSRSFFLLHASRWFVWRHGKWQPFFCLITPNKLSYGHKQIHRDSGNNFPVARRTQNLRVRKLPHSIFRAGARGQTLPP